MSSFFYYNTHFNTIQIFRLIQIKLLYILFYFISNFNYLIQTQYMSYNVEKGVNYDKRRQFRRTPVSAQRSQTGFRKGNESGYRTELQLYKQD